MLQRSICIHLNAYRPPLFPSVIRVSPSLGQRIGRRFLQNTAAKRCWQVAIVASEHGGKLSSVTRRPIEYPATPQICDGLCDGACPTAHSHRLAGDAIANSASADGGDGKGRAFHRGGVCGLHCTFSTSPFVGKGM